MTIQIEIPTTCPSCNSVLDKVNSQIFCRNKECPAQTSKKVEAFIKKMRIKGLGPASISKLGFVHPIEIYENLLDTYVEVLGKKIGQKIFDEIQNSRTTTFATFLSALSIPLIGNTLSKKLANQVNGLDELIHSRDNLDMGAKALENLDKWAYEDEYCDALDLESYFTFSKIKVTAAVKPGIMGKVCITGKLNDFSNRTKAKEFLEEHGYTVTGTISGVTKYLVCEDGSNSSKSKKAESLGIPIVSIVNLIGKY